MRRMGLCLVSVALSATLWAESPEKKGLEVINKANAEAYIGFLASDALEGREAGFRGFLIGETFMKTERPGDTLADFIGGLA